ncbi:glycoside hydrolase family 3 C-terminal domain-containing protein [Microbulbifer thermotolerans]|uniref:glycoside hydrolase family 3 N-terminal domain-containing protein n=1 Tax=Microbulbifer thermotolerans TaxID=252514 RepID=UPI00224B3024|nr:glycoside hydrolase family 3 N-terminal domain-containing protein [Microbulbifer thermotolerans]MCX2783043.1 glycoside hydrolase family 3 C-terminal domain-containing protein [Microbulbifer thermotolerans]WKT60002.1 glycoside hydrolase family 3 N-terminal domain-containing protein [Microbulbifer thermotolerans]
MRFLSIGSRLQSALGAGTCLAILISCGGEPAAPRYRDPGAPVEARVEDLLARMTLEEKVAQLTTLWEDKAHIVDQDLNFDPAKARDRYPHGFGQIARPSDYRGAPPGAPRWRSPRNTVSFINAVQKYATEETRLGIPVLFHAEALHGFATRDATSFPQAIALASSWDTDLVRRVNKVIAREVRARGVPLVLSPVVDIARDPRWGRIEETFGEDPYLVGEMGVAAVEGLQGKSLPLGPEQVFATLKHMTGHGQPESGINVGIAPFGERTLREYFFPPFEQVVKRTQLGALMASYNEIDGVPSHVNKWMLNDVLRKEWGFEGAVVSDYEAVTQLVDLHQLMPDLESAALAALDAGVDTELPDPRAYPTLVDAVRAGHLPEARLDNAVRRMLRLKFNAGLFENPYADADTAEALIDDPAARELALEAARKSLVLLKNDGTLPLDEKAIGTLAVIGPNAAVARLGGYSGLPRHKVSLLDGIRARFNGEVRYAEGVRITENDDWWADEVQLADRAENLRRIKDAVKVAQGADAIVLALGDTEQTSREAWAENHLGDRSSLRLVGEQEELAQALFALGKPVIVVLINGRPPALEAIAAGASGLIEAWYPGQEGGTALAEALFGDINPGGKLPLTFARNAGQLPLYYNHKPSARRGYLFDDETPLFPFGFGLSYTDFEIGAPQLSAPTIAAGGEVRVSVEVRNIGERAGDEVVQLYIRDKVSSVTRPVKELRGFRRLSLQPGETQVVEFTLDSEDLSLWNSAMQRVLEPGEFDIMAGPNSVDLQTVTLTVES